MGKKSGPAPPKPPDPVATSNAQAAANAKALETSARVNAVNLYGPQGSVTYGQYDENGIPKAQYTNLTPQGQQLFDSQQAIAQSLANAAWGKIGQAPMDAFSTAGLGYNPMGYNTSQLPTFNPMSTPVGAPAYYGGNPQMTGQGVFGSYTSGKGMPSPNMPPPGSQYGQIDIQNGINYPGTPNYYNNRGGADLQNQAIAQLNEFEQGQFQAKDAYDALYKQKYDRLNQNRKSTLKPLIPNMDPYQSPEFGGVAPQGFDADAYLQNNPSAQMSGMSPWEHYVRSGRLNGLSLGLNGQAASAPPGAQMGPMAGMQGPMGAMASQGGKGGGQGGQPMPQPQPQGQGLNVLPYDPRSYGDINMYTNKVQDAVFDQQKRNLEPVFQQQYDRELQQLQDRGLPVGGTAYNSAMSNLNRDQSNAWQQASNAAISAAGTEAQRKLGMEQGLRNTSWAEALGQHQTNQADTMQRIQLEQNLRNQALQEMLTGRTQSFNEASAILQGSPALQMMQAPQVPSYQLQAPDVIGAHNAAFQGQMQGYNAQMQNRASMWGGVGQAAGALGSIAAKSARRFKHDYGPAARLIDRLPDLHVGTWRYLPEIDPRQELHIGPFAEDFAAVFGVGNGSDIRGVDMFGVVLKMMQELQQEVAELKKEKANVAKPGTSVRAGAGNGSRSTNRADRTSAGGTAAAKPHDKRANKAAHGKSRKPASKSNGSAAADAAANPGNNRAGRNGKRGPRVPARTG